MSSKTDLIVYHNSLFPAFNSVQNLRRIALRRRAQVVKRIEEPLHLDDYVWPLENEWGKLRLKIENKSNIVKIPLLRVGLC